MIISIQSRFLWVFMYIFIMVFNIFNHILLVGFVLHILIVFKGNNAHVYFDFNDYV